MIAEQGKAASDLTRTVLEKLSESAEKSAESAKKSAEKMLLNYQKTETDTRIHEKRRIIVVQKSLQMRSD